MSIYAIGDIQGCYDSLQQLLKKIQFNSNNDQLWCLGDLINRGPKSLETLRFIKALGDSALSVLGNHDLHLLAAHNKSRTTRPDDTLGAILSAPDCEELIHWLRHRPLAHYNTQYNVLMSHAGILPQWSVNKALQVAHEAEQHLQSDHYTKFIEHMYGNLPHQWSEDLKDKDRFRFIINSFTRMRFISPQGQLEFDYNGASNQNPSGFKPWFEYKRSSSPAQLLFGHWAALKGNTNIEGIDALDTGCVWGGKLTALRLDDNQRFSVNAVESLNPTSIK